MAPGEHEALGPPGLGLLDERLRAERLEARERLGEQLECLVEAAARAATRPRFDAASAMPTGYRAARQTRWASRKQLLGLLEPALVGEDLALVVLRARDVDDIARTPAQLAAAPVELRGLVPAARVVRLDPEVVDDVRLQDEVAGFLEHRQGEPSVLVIGLAERHVADVEEEVGVAERRAVFGGRRVLGRTGAPVETLVEVALPVLDPRRGELELNAAREAVHRGRTSSASRPARTRRVLRGSSEALADDALLAHQPRLRESSSCRPRARPYASSASWYQAASSQTSPSASAMRATSAGGSSRWSAAASARWKSSAATTFADRRWASSPTATE